MTTLLQIENNAKENHNNVIVSVLENGIRIQKKEIIMKTKTLILCAMLVALFAFGMNGANALTEAECDVTPGMTWDGAKCVDAAGEQNPTEYREGIEYIVYKHGAVQTYNAQKVNYDNMVDWSREAQNIIKKEKNINLSEIHGLCANNRMPRYDQIGNPYYSKDGKNCWCQVIADGKTSGWVFRTVEESSEFCARNCIFLCAHDVAMNSSFRGAIVSALD